MSSNVPPRRYVPEPVETTTRSTRRHAPELVETTTKTSRKRDVEHIETAIDGLKKTSPEPVDASNKSSRRFAPQPVETTTRSSKDKHDEGAPRPRSRFAVQPVETTSRSSKDRTEVEKSEKPRSRFVPQPVEMSVRSSKDKPPGEKPHARFAPEPVEITARSSRDKTGKEEHEQGNQGVPSDQPRPEVKPPRRKFAPQLMETSKRSRKTGDTPTAARLSDKTDASPIGSNRRPPPRPLPLAPENTPNTSLYNVPSVAEARRLGCPVYARQDSRSSVRSHSFRIPSLDPIESSESGGSSNASLASSRASSLDDYMDATRRRESVDDRSSGYLLKLAAKAAERQLREQALAAFPNSDFHDPVDHYAVDRESDDVSEDSDVHMDVERRDSEFDGANWDLRAMQRQRDSEEEYDKENKRRTGLAQSMQRASPWGNPAAGLYNQAAGGAAKNISRWWQKDLEVEQMRKGARPPMLGGDIRFPRCPSPEPARFDVTQGSDAIRNRMCYLFDQTKDSDDRGLWHGKKSKATGQSMWSNSSRNSSKAGGLWGGCCVESDATLPRGPTGLMTPRPDPDRLFEGVDPAELRRRLPPSPPPSNSGVAGIDETLEIEHTIEQEFNDRFVTQVYNYLSLGYPSIARKFDDELCKISHIPVSDLRQDDHLPCSRGYIRLGEDEHAKDEGITEETCMRWKALRLYIREWARQQPRMDPCQQNGGWGAAVRRGSWAW